MNQKMYFIEQLLFKESYDLMLENKFMISLLVVRLRQKSLQVFFEVQLVQECPLY